MHTNTCPLTNKPIRKVLKIPSILSSVPKRKQLESCGLLVPALNKVGDACEIQTLGDKIH